jgi:hypothetical protein
MKRHARKDRGGHAPGLGSGDLGSAGAGPAAGSPPSLPSRLHRSVSGDSWEPSTSIPARNRGTIMIVALPFAGRGLSRFGGLKIDIGIAQPSVQNQNRSRDIRQRARPVGGHIERQCALGADRNSRAGDLFHRPMIGRNFISRPDAGTCSYENQQHGPPAGATSS